MLDTRISIHHWFPPVDLPQTTQHPPSPVCPGSTVKFTVTAIAYQWQQNCDDLSEGGGMSDTTTNTLSTASVEKSNEGRYMRVVSNVAGVTSTSNIVWTAVRKCLFLVSCMSA